MALFGTDAWTKAFVEAVNGSKAYEEAAKTWEGDFFFIVEPGAGIKETIYMYVDLWHGKCRKAEVVAAADKDKYKPEFVLSATIPVWRKVNEKKLDSIQAMVTRQMKLQGNMGKIMRAVKAAQELVNAVGAVKTEYPAE
jgi:putative sterol carrier protein